MDQGGVVVPGLDGEAQLLVATVITLAAGALTGPLTAIVKKASGGRVRSVTTVMVSLLLSALVSVVVALAAAGSGAPVNWSYVVLSALLGWARANGHHIHQKQVRETVPERAPEPPHPVPERTGPIVKELP